MAAPPPRPFPPPPPPPGAYANFGPFYVYNTPRTWTQARADCIFHGQDLAWIDSQEENNILTYGIRNDIGSFWIGINDRADEGTWVWANGRPAGFTFWETGEPNDDGGVADCGEMWGTDNGHYANNHRWNDIDCEAYTRKYVCRAYMPPSPPSPSPPPPPSRPPRPPSPPLSPGCTCFNNCRLTGTGLDLQSSDGVCDDGGPGSEWADCPYGTDCQDCGPRCGAMPPPRPPRAPPPPLSAPCPCDAFQLILTGNALATQPGLVGTYVKQPGLVSGSRNVYKLNTTTAADPLYLYYSTRAFDWTIGPSFFSSAYDGTGDWAALTSEQTTAACPGGALHWRYYSSTANAWVWDAGSMTSTCPPPPPPPPNFPGQECLCSDTCRTPGTQVPAETNFLHSDGMCDDGGVGAEYSYCGYGTDCQDCGPRCGLMPPPSPPASPPPPLVACACSTMIVAASGEALRVQGTHVGAFTLQAGRSYNGRSLYKHSDNSYMWYMNVAGGRWQVGPAPGTLWSSIVSVTTSVSCPNEVPTWVWWSGTQWMTGALTINSGAPEKTFHRTYM